MYLERKFALGEIKGTKNLQFLQFLGKLNIFSKQKTRFLYGTFGDVSFFFGESTFYQMISICGRRSTFYYVRINEGSHSINNR